MELSEAMQRSSASVRHNTGAITAASDSYSDLEFQLKKIRRICKKCSAKVRKWSFQALDIHLEKSLWFDSEESYLNLYVDPHRDPLLEANPSATVRAILVWRCG